jgi:ATP-dependent exoDNAse (exonuclease V) alpha subunit
MAIYHFAVKTVSRSTGATAAGAAAYQSAERLQDPRGRWHDFTHKNDVVYSEVLTPEHAPSWMHGREALWRAVEAAEDRSTRPDTAQLARQVEVARPRELPRQERIALARGFALEQFVERGMAVDFSVHEPVSQRDGELQPHAHMLLSMREVTEAGLGGKMREWNSRALLQEWREAWAAHVNAALERAGVAERVDHRTLAAQGIEREPEPKIGATAQAMERRGMMSERGQRFRDVQERNAERALQAEQAQERETRDAGAELEVE